MVQPEEPKSMVMKIMLLPKKAVKKSQPRLQSKEITKAEEKPGISKPKTKKVENPVQDACIGKPEENHNQPVNLPQCEDAVGIADEINPAQMVDRFPVWPTLRLCPVKSQLEVEDHDSEAMCL
ncbi:hypothetical protein PTKIN_Ptkin06aG0058600 [Pterospermum kingtungense]